MKQESKNPTASAVGVVSLKIESPQPKNQIAAE